MEENLKRKSYLRSKRIQANLSSGRKVFRLLKFSDELSSIIRHARSSSKKSRFQEILFYSSGFCAFFYYFLDNIIWLSSKKYKILSRAKDLFSLGRCLIEIWKSLIEIASHLKKEEEILKQLGLYDDCFIAETEESYILIRDLIKLRRQMSFYVLELITNVLRVFMLYKSLKFFGSIYIDSIFVELCGVLSSFFALLKAIKKKVFETTKRRDASKVEKKRVEIYEEEKKSKDLFTLNQDIMSVDDSDVSTENGKFPEYQRYDLTSLIKPNKTMSSTHDLTNSNKSNSRLKQVKSFQNLYKKGALNGLRNLMS